MNGARAEKSITDIGGAATGVTYGVVCNDRGIVQIWIEVDVS